MQDIAPGSTVSVKIVKQPTSAAATKTLTRLLSKDPAARAENERQRKVRKAGYNPKRRGGRLYGGRVVKQQPVSADVGATGTITATVDVLRDLRSVGRFVEIKKT